MTLDGSDILEAFMVNYHKLELSEQYQNTTWTHRILGYFDMLGRMLGYEVHYEKLRYDLTWWDYSKEEYFFFHLEHENISDKEENNRRNNKAESIKFRRRDSHGYLLS